MQHTLLFLGALSAAMAVMVGGIRAHLLANRLEPMRLTMLEVGMRYQFAHATGVILIAMLQAQIDNVLPIVAGWGFLVGTLLFPGMLYAYALTGHKTLLKTSAVGGTVFVLSWICLAIGVIL